jgi:amidase
LKGMQKSKGQKTKIMKPSEEYSRLDAMALTELILRKEVTPRELVETAIERIEELNPTLNAVVTPMYEQALSAANSSTIDGPFAGVPFLLKDLLAALVMRPLFSAWRHSLNKRDPGLTDGPRYRLDKPN